MGNYMSSNADEAQKSQLCEYDRKGLCKYGDSCRNVHEAKERTQTLALPQTLKHPLSHSQQHLGHHRLSLRDADAAVSHRDAYAAVSLRLSLRDADAAVRLEDAQLDSAYNRNHVFQRQVLADLVASGHRDGPAAAGAGRRKPKQCHAFADYGVCKYGSRCHFLHGDEDTRFSDSSKSPKQDGDAKPPAARSRADAEGTRGTPPRTDRGRESPPAAAAAEAGARSGACSAWSKDNPQACRYGDRCRYAHGEGELRSGDSAAPAPNPRLKTHRDCSEENPQSGHRKRDGEGDLRSGAPANRRKTLPCRDWSRDSPQSCRHGDSCQYAHGEGKLRSGDGADSAPKPKKKTLCRDWSKENPQSCQRGDSCRYMHGEGKLRAGDAAPAPNPKLKTHRDRSEQSPQSCKRDGEGDLRSGASANRQKTLLCRDWSKDSPQSCRRGDSCQYAHGKGELRSGDSADSSPNRKWKTLLCRDWSKENPQSCRRGDRCQYAHGKGELRAGCRRTEQESPPNPTRPRAAADSCAGAARVEAGDRRCPSRQPCPDLRSTGYCTDPSCEHAHNLDRALQSMVQRGCDADMLGKLFRFAGRAVYEAEMDADGAGEEAAELLAEKRAELEGLFVAAAARMTSRQELAALLRKALSGRLRDLWGGADEDTERRRCTVVMPAVDVARRTAGDSSAAQRPCTRSAAVRCLLDEVKLVVEMEHSNLERVVSFYERDGCLCYEKEIAGQRLQQWFEAGSPAAGCARQVVRDYLAVLAHLEGRGVRHGRVRPCVLRVRVDGGGAARGVLCDLRTAGTDTDDGGGDGEGGWETGLPADGCDVQQLGRSLAAALPGLGDEAVRWFRSLAERAPTAAEALDEEGWLNRCCVVCMDQAAGTECSNGHVICTGCFEEMLNEPDGSDSRRDGLLLCCAPGCDAGPFKVADLVGVMPQHVWERCQAAEQSVMRERARLEGAREAERMVLERELDKARRDVEEAMNLRCPSCGQVFTDWTNCVALRCHLCSGRFCGYCLQDFGDATQAHVSQCSLSPVPGQIYPDRQSAEKAHRQLRQRRLDELVRGLRPVIVPELARVTRSALSTLGVEVRVP